MHMFEITLKNGSQPPKHLKAAIKIYRVNKWDFVMVHIIPLEINMEGS